MKTEYVILFLNDEDEKVAEAGPFSTREEMKQVRYCLNANCGLRLECVERVTYLDEQDNDK